MTRHTDMITLIADLFMDAYMAGQQTDLSSYNRARADRDRLLAEVNQLYHALDDSEEHINDQMHEIEHLRNELKAEKEMSARKEDLLQKLLGPTEDELKEWAAGPDDMEPELRDCLPFPDVEDLEGASGLLGGDE